MNVADKAKLFQENVRRARADRGFAASPFTRPVRTIVPAESLHPCRFLLPILSRTDAAGLACSCPGKWLRGCEIHGQCRIDQESVDGCCRTCEQRQPPAG